MNLSLKSCNKSNRHFIEKLSVADSQKSFIESNSDSLKEADEYSFWRPVGLYDNDVLVGFAMYGQCEEDANIWLDRFMIAKDFQNQGYGKKFLHLLIQTITYQYHCQQIYLSYLPHNTFIADFFPLFGFKATGEKDPNGEIIMCLNLA